MGPGATLEAYWCWAGPSCAGARQKGEKKTSRCCYYSSEAVVVESPTAEARLKKKKKQQLKLSGLEPRQLMKPA